MSSPSPISRTGLVRARTTVTLTVEEADKALAAAAVKFRGAGAKRAGRPLLGKQGHSDYRHPRESGGQGLAAHRRPEFPLSRE